MMKRERVTVAPKETEVRSVDDVENQDWIYKAGVLASLEYAQILRVLDVYM